MLQMFCKFENAQKYWELINANVIFNNIEPMPDSF